MSVLDHAPVYGPEREPAPRLAAGLDALAVNLGACIVACLAATDVMEGTGALEEFRTIDPVVLVAI